MIEKDKKKILDLVQELKQKGLIEFNRRIIFDNISHFIGADAFYKIIKFNQNCPISQNDYVLIYFLLHEEGHFKRFSNKNILTILYLIIFIIFLINYFSLLLIPMGLVLIFVYYRIFSPFLHEDELLADFYAAQSLKQEYGILEPSKITEETFEFMRIIDNIFRKKMRREKTGIVDKMISFDFLITQKIYKFINTHPSPESRIAHIREKVDNN